MPCDEARSGVVVFVRRHCVPVAVLLLALAVRFHRLTLGGAVDLVEATAVTYYPLAANLFSHVRQGDLPLWSPEILLGYPAAASIEAHLFSPLHWPYLVFAPARAVVVWLVSTQVCAALTMYALARRVGAGAVAATLAGVLWVTGGPARLLLILPMAAGTVAWFPLVLMCWDRYCRTGVARWAAASGTVLGFALLGGDVQFVYWFVACACGHAACVDVAGERLRAAGRALRGLATMGILALLIGAINVLPTQALLRDSIRDDLSGRERIHTEDLSYLETLRALKWVVACDYLPDRKAEGDVGYRAPGVLALGLASLAIGRRRPFDNRLLCLAAFLLLLSLGALFPPSNWVLKWLPGNNFRYPARIGLFFSLIVVLLAARGAQRLVATDARQRPEWSWLPLTVIGCVGPIMTLVDSGNMLERAEGQIDVLILVLLGCAAWLPATERARRLRTLLPVLAASATVVLSAVMNVYDPFVSMTDVVRGPGRGITTQRPGHEGPFPPTVLAALPGGDADGPIRILDTEAPWSHNATMLTWQQSPLGMVSLRPARVDRLVYGRRMPSDEEAAIETTLLQNQTLLDLLNVRYVLVGRGALERFAAWPRGSLTVVSRGVSHVVIENRSRLPRSFFVTQAVWARSEEDAWERVTTPGFDPRREVVLESPEAGVDSATGIEPVFTPAKVTRYEHERVDIEVDAVRAGWLVLLDGFHAEWRCRVDGRATPVLRADYLFRAVRVPAGRSTVTFTYVDVRFTVGAILSSIGVLAGAVAVFMCIRSRESVAVST